MINEFQKDDTIIFSFSELTEEEKKLIKTIRNVMNGKPAEDTNRTVKKNIAKKGSTFDWTKKRSSAPKKTVRENTPPPEQRIYTDADVPPEPQRYEEPYLTDEMIRELMESGEGVPF